MENDRKKLKKSKKNAGRVRRGNPTVTATQRTQFLDALREYGNVTYASRKSGFETSTAYDWRERDPNFAKAWADALVEATDSLELEAFKRGRDGYEKPVVSMGKIVTFKDNNDKVQVLTERVVSDAILLRLLQAHKPERYGQASQTKANDIPLELQPDPEPTPDEPRPEKPVS